MFLSIENKKRLAWQKAQKVAYTYSIRSSARVFTLPDLAPSQRFGGCREFTEPVLSLALDECRVLSLNFGGQNYNTDVKLCKRAKSHPPTLNIRFVSALNLDQNIGEDERFLFGFDRHK